MTDRRIVITGIGVISPLGNDLASTWEAMKAGRSGIDTIKSMDVTGYSTKIAGEVKDFDPAPYFKTPKDARRVDRFTHFAMGAAGMALKDSGLDLEAEDKTRIGVMVGSGIGGLGTLESQHATLLSKGPARVSPFMIPYMISNIASGLISMEYGLGGPNMSIVTACATSNHNIGEAWRIMKFGDADVMVCGGAEATILPTGVAGFSNMKALSSRNDEPQRASRPYDVDRDGFVMGEGAGVVILETLEHAGMKPEDIDYVNTHGTSTPLGDICEIKAIKAVFGDHAKNGLLISSTKSMTGHLLGAAGGVELAACLMAMQDNIIPPTINVDNQDPECDLDCVPNKARETRVDAVLSNSFGFGGHNSSVIVKRFA